MNLAEPLRSEDIGLQIKANLEVFNKIDDRFDKLMGKTKELNTALTNVFDNKSIGGVSRSLNTASKRLETTTNSAKGLKTGMNELYTSFDKSQNRFKGLAETQRTYNTQAKQTDASLQKTQSAVNRFNKTSTDRVSRSFKSTTSSAQKMAGASTRLSSAGSKFINVGQNMAITSTVIGAAMLKGATDAVKLQNQYRVINNLAVYGGEKQAEVQRNVNKMQQQGSKYSVQYGVAQTKLSAGYEELIRRGYSTNQALATQKTFLQGALASGDDYTDVVHNATAAIEGFGLKSANSTKMAQNTKMAVNQMAYAADLTATDFQGMGDALRYVAATGRSANQSLSMTTSAIGILSNNGLEDTVAGTGLRKILNSFGSPNFGKMSQQAPVMEQFGWTKKSFEDSKGNLKSLADLMDMINKKTAKMSDSQRMDIFHKFFGTTGQESALILSKNVKQLRDLNNQVKGSQNMKGGGYISQLSKKNLLSAQAQINIFKQAVNGLGISFATTVLPNLTSFVKGLDKMLMTINELPTGQKKMVTMGITAVAAIAPISLAIGGLSKGLGTVIGLWSKLRGAMSVKLPNPVESVTVSSSTAIPGGGISGTRSGSTHFAGAVGGIKGQWANSSFLGKATIVATGTEIGLTAVNAFKDGIGTKKGGQELWNAGGQAVGAGIGLALGGPVGAAAGTAIGGAITDAIDLKKVKKYLSDPSTGKSPEATQQRKQDREKQKLRGKYYSNANSNPDVDAANKVLDQNGVKGFKSAKTSKTSGANLNDVSRAWANNKNASSSVKFINKAAALEQKANQQWALSAGKVSGKLKSTYDSLYQSASKYSNKQLSNEKKNFDFLQKQGVLSSGSAGKAYEAEKSAAAKRLASLKSSLNSLVTADSKGGKDRIKAINRVNHQILALTDNGGKKQASMLRSLNARTTHLNLEQYSKVIAGSNKAYKVTVSNAHKTYSNVIANAEKRYKAEVKAANNLKGISADQRHKIIINAQNQRSKTVSNAYAQYKSTVAWAAKQRQGVVAEAKKQATDAAHAMTGAFDAVPGIIGNMLNQNLKAGLTPNTTKTQSLEQELANNTNRLNSHQLGDSGSKTKPKIQVPTGIAHASGGAITKSHIGLVGEAGKELAYNPLTGRIRLLGANGPMMADLQPGEHILNAKATAKVLRGGLGAGVTLPGYAEGTTSIISVENGQTGKSKLGVTTAKEMEKAAKKTQKSVKKMSKGVSSNYDDMYKTSTNRLKSLNQQNSRIWNDTSKDTNRSASSIRKQSYATFTGMSKDFYTIMSKFGPYAHHGMALAVNALNGGIRGINSTLTQFGGGTVLNPIHYAEGSKGPISTNQLAVLNDAKTGPRQEAVVRGGHLLIPKGNDVLTPLKKGDHVLNGSELQAIVDSVPHFAKGTRTGKEALKSLITANSKKPASAFNSEFTKHVSTDRANSPLSRGFILVGRSGATPVGNKWSGAAWSALANAMNGAGAGGAWAHTPGLAVSDGFGSSRASMYGAGATHDGVDFSGPMGAAIRAVHGGNVIKTGGVGISDLGDVIIVKSSDGFDEIYQEFGNMGNIKVSVGDTVRTGQTIATLGALNGAGSGSHVHIGVTRGNPLHKNMLSTAGWYDVTKMKGSSSGVDESKKKQDGPLQKLVKKQLASQIKWVGKNLMDQDTVGSIGSLSLAGGLGSRARALAQAIKSAYPSATTQGIAAVLGNWAFESGLNPGAINPGGGASGLGQWLGGRKANLINYAKRRGQNWKSASAQLGFALSGDGSDSSVLKRILSGTGSVASLAAAFSNQWERGGYTAQHVAKAESIASALKGFKDGGDPEVGKWHKVNEDGFELFKPKERGTVIPHNQSKRIVANAAGRTKIEANYDVHVEVNGSAGSDTITKAVKRALKEHDEELIVLINAERGDNSAYEFI
ncbi:phage tail tape measure protein [Secundilactobacillus kimchicus]|uniref:phage tail tape measure protein n=1 Tax=Secundilactobacillus kimchicus TaxID=528209 RepID=UPI0024A8A0FC|nr:phage tail tape measure protein [Secundilactobacillus kimchicus]